MNIIRRAIINSTLAFALITTTGTAFADTGGRTAGRADFDYIVFTVKGKTNSKVTFSKSEVKTFNGLKEGDRSAYIAKVVSQHLQEKERDGWIEILSIISRQQPWCGACKESKGRVSNKMGYKDGISAFISASF